LELSIYFTIKAKINVNREPPMIPSNDFLFPNLKINFLPKRNPIVHELTSAIIIKKIGKI
jgi:hypothetical protein